MNATRNAPTLTAVTAGDLYGTFARLQALRLLFRAQLAIKAILPVAFWVGLASLYILADRAGFGWPVAALAAAWVLVMLPHMIFEASLILDALNYLLTGRAQVYGWLKSMPAPDETGPAAERVRRIAFALAVAGATSPLNALAFWCYGVLMRAPEKAYARAAQQVRARKATAVRRKEAPETVEIDGRRYIRREWLRRYGVATDRELSFV